MKSLDNQLSCLKKFIEENKDKLQKDEFNQIVAKEMTNFYVDKNYFNKLFELFNDYHLNDFAIKAQSVYFAYKSIEYKESLKNIPSNKVFEIKREFNKLCELFDSSIAGKNFIHYIQTHSLLNGVDVINNNCRCEQDLIPYLKKISWEHKEFLYTKLVKNIVKLNTSHTKASVVIISNGDEEYIIETLEEIAKQKNDDYKIIFVSNNKMNQTQKVLNLVDTFIQMRGNDGAYLARNVGSIFGFSDVLIFLEDDGIPKKEFVKNHLQCYKDKDIMSVRGCYLSKTNGSMPLHYWLGMNSKPAVTMLEGNCSFKTKEFYRVSGWGDYIMFGHGGLEICHRFLSSLTKPNQHIYSPKPILYHDYTHPNKDLIKKRIVQHASWQILKFSYENFHNILSKWKNDTI